MNLTVEDYLEVKEKTGCNDTAAAILVLADAVRHSTTFSPSNAENFGHELALAMKEVLSSTQIQIVSESNAEIFGQELALALKDVLSSTQIQIVNESDRN